MQQCHHLFVHFDPPFGSFNSCGQLPCGSILFLLRRLILRGTLRLPAGRTLVIAAVVATLALRLAARRTLVLVAVVSTLALRLVLRTNLILPAWPTRSPLPKTRLRSRLVATPSGLGLDLEIWLEHLISLWRCVALTKLFSAQRHVGRF